jgi:membrane-associated phospholipid phosphatase
MSEGARGHVVALCLALYDTQMPRALLPLRRRRVLAGTTALALLAVAACGRSPAASEVDPRMLSEWMHVLYGSIRVERLSPPVASRLAAYASTALYAGLASARPSLRPLDGALNDLPDLPRAADAASVDATIVAVTAERMVLDSLMAEALPTTRAAIARLADSLVADRQAQGVGDVVRERSDSLGRAIGAVLVAWAGRDGFAGTRGRAYVPPVGDALWVNDNPASTFATQNLSGVSELITMDNPANQQRAENTGDRGLILSRPKPTGAGTMLPVNVAGATEPYWIEQRPFVLTSWNACPIDDPPPYSTDTASVLYRNAKAVYDLSRSLTEDQRTIAYYWADNPGESGTPVGHWLSIAAQLIDERALSADDAARLLLATSLSQGDAFIAAWGYKYTFNLLRPRTYIRRVIDSTWEPLLVTPPFPEYPAGHSTQSAAAATVMTGLLGAQALADSTSVTLGHAVRTFASFTAASDEAGMSRRYGGIHYEIGDLSGRAVGRCVGERVLERLGVAARR